ALLHDLGKPAVDQKITLYRANGQRLGIWDPWAGPMTRVGHCHNYMLDYCRTRQYRSHERAAPLLVHHILPSHGLSWIASEPQVFAQWLATISGNMDEAGPLGEIIQEADGISVARNLGANAPRAAMTKTKALWERLLTGLRHLILEGELPLNRNGAAGWLRGDDLWMVSKRTIDALRAHLLAEGHSGIPSSNDRIYDTLQEHGILTPCGDRAIWRATVSGEGWSHELTLIRLPVHRIWPQSTDRPEDFVGQVQPAEPPAPPVAGDEPTTPDNQAMPSAVTEVVSNTQAASIEDAALPRPDLPVDGTSPTDDIRHQTVSSSDHDDAQPPTPITDNPDVPPIPNEAGTKMHTEATNSDAGRRFLAWLQRQAAQNALSVNNPSARLHVVEEGVLLISPALFKDYANSHPADGDWGHVQKRFMKMKLHQRLENGTNIHRYVVSGERNTSHVKGILLPDPSVIWGADQQVPPPNHHLKATNS
ncbi:MobH family relaxase, partial [Ectothiorhodospira variabilis]